MKVILAEAMGMCFGVRDALKRTAAVAHPEETTILGELVHNEVVLHQLETRGFRQQPEQDRAELPQTPAVLITAHGVSDAERARLLAAGKQLVDTTCPLVRRVHEAARQLVRDGFHVLVLGKRGHVEVQGIVGDLESYDVIGSAQEVRAFPHQRLGIVCQTTLPPDAARELCSYIALHNQLAEIRFVDTICEPTRRRQQAIRSLLDEVDAVVVVGGRNSNNTKQLAALCREHGRPVLHVQEAADLDFDWLASYSTIGLTAGTSTLESTIREVYQALLRHSEGASSVAPT